MPRPISEGADTLIDKYFPVLDHGFIALVDYMGNDESIEHAARVSYGKGTRQTNKTRGLLRYLKRHSHTTPFEMVELKFHVAMPIFVARQWIRHRTAAVNEYSGRYSLMSNVTFTPDHWRLQSKSNNQGSSAHVLTGPKASVATFQNEQFREDAFAHYEWLNANDVAKELSRIDLPLSTYTQWYWKIDLHNLMHFLRLRCDGHAQQEIRVYADMMAGVLQEAFPISYEAWVDYQFESAHFSRMEREVLVNMATHGTKLDDLDNHTLSSFGLTSREIDEFRLKLDIKYSSFSSAHQPAPARHILPASITPEEAFIRMFPEGDFDADV